MEWAMRGGAVQESCKSLSQPEIEKSPAEWGQYHCVWLIAILNRLGFHGRDLSGARRRSGVKKGVRIWVESGARIRAWIWIWGFCFYLEWSLYFIFRFDGHFKTFLFFFLSKPTPLPLSLLSLIIGQPPSTIPTKEHHLRSSPTSFQPPFSGQLIGSIFKAFRCLCNRFEGKNWTFLSNFSMRCFGFCYNMIIMVDTWKIYCHHERLGRLGGFGSKGFVKSEFSISFGYFEIWLWRVMV